MDPELRALVDAYATANQKYANTLWITEEELSAEMPDQLRAIHEESLLFLIDAGMALLRAKRRVQESDAENR